jgi:hypothetical protein
LMHRLFLWHILQKPFSQANLFELVVNDEKQLKKLESLINSGISAS